ncbi:MAG: butyrate kinase [Bacteroidia bacterium]|nr:butyrate kinase [Bacteroidia bacterium]
MTDFYILAINPGSTSTKIAVYRDRELLFAKTIRHSNEELSPFSRVTDQFDFRKEVIIKELQEANIILNNISAVVGRGGLLRPIESGIYEVNEKMKNDLLNNSKSEHASNLGGLIADDIAGSLPDAKAYIVDPIVVDEMQDVARLSGHPLIERISIFHALNQKAIARTHARSVNRHYEDMNLIVAHMGGGISVGAHLKGRVIDSNQALDGDGPFSPERSGTLPMGDFTRLCFSGKYSYDEVKQMITGKGGLVAYMNTNDAWEVETKARNGDNKAKLVQDAMSYQIAKEIGSQAAVLKGEVDAILLTGGLAYNPDLVHYIREMVSFIAPVVVYPGEDEMSALAMNGLMVLKGELIPKEY